MASSLGKRKEREETGAESLDHGSTLFVSNLPYTATSTDLQTLFSDIAPVRSAFVVLEHGTGVSKGVGYVSFAIKEDAQSAFDSIAKEALILDGRKLRLQWADVKPKDGETLKREPKPRPPPRTPHPRAVHDPHAIRTIIVSGLPSSIDSGTLWKKIRKYEGADSVEWPAKSESGEEDPSKANVLFKTSAAAQEAVNRLHAHVYKGSLLSVTLKKRLDSLSKAPSKPSKPTTSDPTSTTPAKVSSAPNRASRLIVRNLPFKITEQDLRAVFLPYGPIHSIHIPTGEGNKAKGFAFVWMLSKKDAEKALEECNGKAVRAGMAEGLVTDKQKRKKVRREEKKKLLEAGKAEEGAEADDGEKVVEERAIAVDWALSKEKWQEEQAKMDVDEDDAVDVKSEEGSSGSSSGGGEDDSDDEEGGGGEEDNIGVHEHGSDNSDPEDSDDEEDIVIDAEDEKPVKPQLPPPETGTTLFVRNVPFAATEDELRTLFRAFGALRYARITLDPATGRSRGTGFACFWNKADADKVVEQSSLLRAEMTGGETLPKKNPFTLPSILTPDPSSTMAQSLVLHGRTLDVARAVTRDEAGKLKEEGERRREKADKRNLYLLREGVILPSAPAAETLTPAEIERRTGSFNARRMLLRSNPSLYISKTRLSIRQIPIFVTERVLKRLAIHAVRAFQTEVKKGMRAPLTQDELTEIVDEDEEAAATAAAVKAEIKAEEGDAKGKKGFHQGARSTGVKQAKIVRQHERVDPVTGKGRSKGYGFLEMLKHADALRVLRWSNNNPEVTFLFEKWWKDELTDLIKKEKAKGKEEKDEARLKRMQEELEKTGPKGAKGTLIAEFSIENVQVVQRRSAIQKDRVSTETRQPREKIALRPKAEEAPTKKRRLSAGGAKAPAAEAPPKSGNNIGSLIGRKRKERKSGKR